MTRKNFMNSFSCTPLPHELPSHRKCQWMEGEGRDKRFTCADETVLGSSYCVDHHRIVYVQYVPESVKRRVA